MPNAMSAIPFTMKSRYTPNVEHEQDRRFAGIGLLGRREFFLAESLRERCYCREGAIT